MFEAELDVCRFGTKPHKKSPLMNGRGGTHSEPIGGGRAPKNKSSDVILSNWEGAGGFSKQRREREREPRRMMMIVTGNKRGVDFTPMIEYRGR